MATGDEKKPRKLSDFEWRLFLAFVVVVGYMLSQKDYEPRIGATASVVESQSGLSFITRVDTGASLTSLHCELLEIPNESENPRENIGKKVRVLLASRGGEQKWIEAMLVDYAEIRTVDAVRPRYHVRLKLRCQDVEKEALVTLDDRRHMKYRMLLGREFLRDTFVVDVAQDNHELR